MISVTKVHSEADSEKVRSLFQEYKIHIGFDLCFQNFEEELKSLPGDYALPYGCLLIGKKDENIAGCVALRKIDDGICEMKRLFVRSKYQGLGIGRALAEAIIAEAQKIGYQVMRLDTIPSMKKASVLYASLGFMEIAPYEVVWVV